MSDSPFLQSVDDETRAISESGMTFAGFAELFAAAGLDEAALTRLGIKRSILAYRTAWDLFASHDHDRERFEQALTEQQAFNQPTQEQP